MASLAEATREMLERHLKARGIKDARVLKAMATVKREAFVPDELVPFAYEDRPLPIGEGQTISQPFMVAYMIEALGLKKGARVLEIGTGSGYAAAVLAEIAKRVITIERHAELAESARRVLAKLNYANVEVVVADGSKGWPKEAPYDGIVVTAAGPRAPEALKRQLKLGASLVVPVGEPGFYQTLLKITRTGENAFEESSLGGVAFVPLIGEEGF
jgi:protein-L-isoaspartate(D-aspartate) O-methyltransferase